MEVIGKVNIIKPLPRERNNRYRFEDHLFQRLGENTQAELRAIAGPYYRVIGTTTSVEKSIKKMDKARVVEFKKSPYWKQAKDVVFRQYRSLFAQNTRQQTLDEVIANMQMGTAAGQPWQFLGLKKKRDCWMNERFLDYICEDPTGRKAPVWSVSPKTEKYHAVDLDNDKVRTFIIPPLHLLIWQKILYDTQNKAMKEFWWSAYGFNPYQGGVNKYASYLNRHKKFIYYDVSGWDRQLPIMPTVYQIRNYHSDAPEFIKCWVTEQTIYSTLLLTDGTLVLKKIGNNSGSGNTTNDNILAHCLILATVLLDLFDGDEDAVLDTVAYLFGDDNAMSLTYNGPRNLEDVFRKGYRQFGLELDPFVVQETLEGVEFLGFKFHNLGDAWIPVYPQDKLVSSFSYTIEKKDSNSVSLSRAWILTVMAAGGDRRVFDLMTRAVDQMIYLLQDDQDPVVRAFCEMGAPSYEDVINFYLGRESMSPMYRTALFQWRLEDEINRLAI